MDNQSYCTYLDEYLGQCLTFDGKLFPAIYKRKAFEMDSATLYLVKATCCCLNVEEAKFIAKKDLVDAINDIAVIFPNKNPSNAFLLFFLAKNGYDIPGFNNAKNITNNSTIELS